MHKATLLIIVFIAASLAQTSEITPQLATIVARYRAIGTLQVQCTGSGTAASPQVPQNITSVLTEVGNPSNVLGSYSGGGFAGLAQFFANDGSVTRVVAPISSTASGGNLTNFLSAANRVPGDRTFDRIVFITRYDTLGGTIDPATACNATGQFVTVDFAATYGFYRSATPPVSTLLRSTAIANGTVTLLCSNNAYTAPTTISSTLYSDDALTTPVGTYTGLFTNNDGSSTRATGNLPGFPVDNAPGAALSYFVQTASVNIGTRAFDNVGFISRYDTVGGVRRSTDDACTSANNGTSITVPFRATYGFYQAIPGTSSATTIGVSAFLVAMISLAL